jgi:beta-N-acetylhexosaminidase
MEKQGSTTQAIQALTASPEDITKLHGLWSDVFPSWPVSQDFFNLRLFAVPSYRHYVHEHGFCLSFLSETGDGRLVAVGVLPDYRRQGLGTALVEKAKEGLKTLAKEMGGELKSIQVGSQLPRFWPYMPKALLAEAETWLMKNGRLSFCVLTPFCIPVN